MDVRRTRRRLSLTVLIVFALVAVFAVRLVDIQVVRASELSTAAEQHRTMTETIWATRGGIVTSDGTVLADSVDRFDITVSPKNVDLATTSMLVDDQRRDVPTADAFAAISAITGTPAADLSAAITDALADDPKSDFAYLVKSVKLDVFEKVRALEIPWIYAQLHPARSYPNGAVAGNLVGFLGTDGPQAGVELGDDECLAATNGASTYEASADGVRLPGSTVVQEEPIDGGTLRLSIDSDLQWYAQQVLDREGRALGAEWATAMVVRVDDGHIMAAADWPSVDPNNVDLVEDNAWGARSFTSPFEPGSVIKPATVASLIDAGAITMDERWKVPGVYTKGLPGDAFIKDNWAHDTIKYTTAGILVNSSNVGISMMSRELPAEERSGYLRDFGFDDETGVGFLGESSGLLLPEDQLDSISSMTQQFGQGMSATSAQLAGMYQTLGNHGVRMPLTLVEGCEREDGTVTQAPDDDGSRVVSADAADQVVAAMENVVSDGPLTGVVDIPGYRIAAKTGTAEVAEGGVYTDDRIISVAGLVPAENPAYAVVVTFAKPDTIKTSVGAAPAFESIAKQVIKTFRIQPSTEKAPDVQLTW
jgi:cell division protein FtsI (penicillin-binding protein 3)